MERLLFPIGIIHVQLVYFPLRCLFIYLVLKGGRNLLLRLLIRSFSGHLATQTLPSFHQWILRSFGWFFGVEVHPYLWGRSPKPMSGFLMLAPPIWWITIKHNKNLTILYFSFIWKKKTSPNFFNCWRWWDSWSQKVGYMASCFLESSPKKRCRSLGSSWTRRVSRPVVFGGFCLKSISEKIMVKTYLLKICLTYFAIRYVCLHICLLFKSYCD